MLLAITGCFKPDAEGARRQMHEQYNAHLGQWAARVRFGGSLFDEAGERCAVLLVTEVADRMMAEAVLQASPYAEAGLYARTDMTEIRLEIIYLR